MSWAEPIDVQCPRCESLACTETDYSFVLEIGNKDVPFNVFVCRQCGLKFDVRADTLR
jgi:hypothetical protein